MAGGTPDEQWLQATAEGAWPASERAAGRRFRTDLTIVESTLAGVTPLLAKGFVSRLFIVIKTDLTLIWKSLRSDQPLHHSCPKW